MGMPFIRRLTRKHGDRFYVCRFCRTPIASALEISVAKNGTISRGTIPDLVNVNPPNPPKKWGRQTIQEFYCTHCNRRLGRKSIQVRRKPSGAEFFNGGGMQQLLRGMPDPDEWLLANEVLDDEELDDGIMEDDNYVVPEPEEIENIDGQNPPPSRQNLYICRTCYNKLTFTHFLLEVNCSPLESGLTGDLFQEAANVDYDGLREVVDIYTISDVYCNQCRENLGWAFVEVRAPPDMLPVKGGDHLLIMDRLMILIVDDDDPPHQILRYRVG